MSVRVQTAALSALNPIEISYNFNSKEVLDGRHRLYTNGLQAFDYKVFKNFEDAAISKKTVLVLTNVKDLKDVFRKPFEPTNIGNISGNCYLQTSNNPLIDGDIDVKLYQNNLYVGGKGTPAVFTIIPIERNSVELKVKDFYVQVSENYPYEINLSLSPLPNYQRYRQRFTIEFSGNFICFKHKTKEGTFRALSYNKNDRKLKCTGVQLNQAILNDYLFFPIFTTTTRFTYGYNPTIQEIRYYNFIDSGVKQKSADILEKTKSNTNLLVTIPISKLLNTTTASANMSILKTSFSSAGAFLNTL